jgi:hypothetical protein
MTRQPMPWLLLLGLPPLLFVYNVYAAHSTISEEYVMNKELRAAMSRKDGWTMLLMLVSLLGPDSLLLFCLMQFPRFGARLSRTNEQLMLFWALGLHIVCDVPAAAANVLFHIGYGGHGPQPWDSMSKTMLSISAASLSLNLLWHIVRLCSVRPDDDDQRPEMVREGRALKYVSPNRMLRRIDTAKYAGISGAAPSGYEA